jgi:IclR family transcriptional regulator, acetate operon repressor
MVRNSLMALKPVEDTRTVLAKASAILQAFDDFESGLSLQQIVERSGLSRSTTHRLCGQLVELQLLSRRNNDYDLGQILMGASGEIVAYRNLRSIAEPYLFDLFALSGISTLLTIRQGVNIRYLSRVVSARTIKKISTIEIWGERPLYSTASGKAMMAYARDRNQLVDLALDFQSEKSDFEKGKAKKILNEKLDQAKLLGYASEYEEVVGGWKAIAAPILPGNRQVIGAVAMSSPISEVNLEKFIPNLIETAKTISEEFSKLRLIENAN